MSAVKDFNELHIGIKSTMMTVAFQIPFFFIAIFLFRHNLIDKIDTSLLTDLDFYFLLSLCFCFSTTWFILNIVSAWLILSVVDKIMKTNSEPHELYVTSMIYSLVYLSGTIVLAYTFNWTFNGFLSFAYCFIFIRIVCTIIGDFFIKKIIP